MCAVRLSLISPIFFCLVACGGDGTKSPIRLALQVPVGGNPQALSISQALTTTAGSAGLTVADDGGNTLVIASAEVSLREIEFERAHHSDDCDDVPSQSGSDDHHDACEKFELPGAIVALPLDGSSHQVITANIDPDTYDEVEFDIHKLDQDDDADVLALRPEFEDQSIRVTGTYNGTPFTYENDLTEEQEIELNPPLDVTAGDPNVSVTLSIDIGAWFVDGDAVIDPATASEGEPNHNLVEDNIKNSIDGFRDDDEDGERD